VGDDRRGLTAATCTNRPAPACPPADESNVSWKDLVPKLRVHSLTMSLDGYVAGPEQGPEQPLGVGGERLHEWVYPTRTFARMTGQDGGETGVDDDFVARGEDNIGATVMGRNMFGPVRGAWPDASWTGW
jgi:hypothetical protein